MKNKTYKSTTGLPPKPEPRCSLCGCPGAHFCTGRPQPKVEELPRDKWEKSSEHS